MEWFEKEYKKRFEDESSLEGVDSNDLWSQITESIPQKKSTSPYWKWSLFSLILIGAATTWFLLVNDNRSSDSFSSDSNSNSQEIVIQQENQSNIEYIKTIAETQAENNENNNLSSDIILEDKIIDITDQNDAKINNTNKTIASLEKKEIINPSSNHSSITNTNETTTSIKNKLNLDSNAPSNNHQASSLKPETRLKSEFEKGTAIETETKSEFETISNSTSVTSISPPSTFGESSRTVDATTEYDDQNKSNLINDEAASTKNEASSNSSKRRNLIEIENIGLLNTDVLQMPNTLVIPSVSPPHIKVERINPFAIGVRYNVNFLDLKYSDAQNPELFAEDANDAQGLLQIGNGFAINLGYQLNRSWSISTGFEFNNYENKLDVILTTDTMTLDATQKLRRTNLVRTVVHHNKLSTYSLPFSIAYEKYISNRISLGTSIGASYSIIKSQRGRFLDRNSTIGDYTDTENRQFDNFLSLRINPFLNYGISEKFTLSINASLSIQNHGSAEVQDLTQSSIIYNAGLGLIYKL